MCKEPTRHLLTRCCLEDGHSGGHRGVLQLGRVTPAGVELVFVAWSKQESDPIVVGSY